MERACKQLPRSYKLWKMVSDFYLKKNPKSPLLLTVLVSGVPNKSLEGPQSHGLSRRVPESQRTLRTSPDSPEQDAAHLGNVPLLPAPAADGDPDSTNLRPVPSRFAGHTAQPDLETVQRLRSVCIRTDCYQNLCSVHANSPREHRGLHRASS